MVLASKTGWAEHHIRWELPLCRGWAYYHTARLMEGERTQWPGQTEAMDAWLENIRLWANSPHSTPPAS